MMEETEYAFLRSRGLCVVLYDERGTLGFPRLSASLKIHQPLAFEARVTVRLRLTEIDGKQITYEFEIVDEETGIVDPTEIVDETSQPLAVEGRFQVACCRFPDDKPPFAILTPDHVIQALTQDESISANGPQI